MSTFVVRYQIKPDQADENQRLVEKVFEELKAEAPDGFRYATFRLEDGVSFIHIVTYENAGDPLGSSAAFQEFQNAFADRMAAPPERGRATVVGSYGFFGN